MNTENKEDITDTITSDYPINESKTVETSPDILVGSTEDVTNGGLNKITLYIEDATEEYFAVEEFTEINIIENTSFQESIVRETKPKVTLHIQNQSQRKEVFTYGNVFGLQCEATSKVDIDIEYSWTKNGRFVDLSGPRIFLESEKRGNLVILKPNDEDEGLYQCVASNSEGVVFSRVIQVESKQKLNSIARIPQRLGGGGRSLDFSNDVQIVLPASNGRFEAENIMIVESQPYLEPDN